MLVYNYKGHLDLDLFRVEKMTLYHSKRNRTGYFAIVVIVFGGFPAKCWSTRDCLRRLSGLVHPYDDGDCCRQTTALDAMLFIVRATVSVLAPWVCFRTLSRYHGP